MKTLFVDWTFKDVEQKPFVITMNFIPGSFREYRVLIAESLRLNLDDVFVFSMTYADWEELRPKGKVQ